MSSLGKTFNQFNAANDARPNSVFHRAPTDVPGAGAGGAHGCSTRPHTDPYRCVLWEVFPRWGFRDPGPFPEDELFFSSGNRSTLLAIRWAGFPLPQTWPEQIERICLGYLEARWQPSRTEIFGQIFRCLAGLRRTLAQNPDENVERRRESALISRQAREAMRIEVRPALDGPKLITVNQLDRLTAASISGVGANERLCPSGHYQHIRIHIYIYTFIDLQAMRSWLVSGRLMGC